MREAGQMMIQKKRIASIFLAIWMLFSGLYAGELRVSSAHFSPSEGQQPAVFRVIPDVLFSDEACTGAMIGARTRLPELRSFRPEKRQLRACLLTLLLSIAALIAVLSFFARQSACFLPRLAQRLLQTIQYIHNLDGKKSN